MGRIRHECSQCGRSLRPASDQTDPAPDSVAVDTRGLVSRDQWVCGRCLDNAQDTPQFRLPPLHCLTDAPIDYDYGWMQEVNPNWGKTDRGRTVRLCRNDDRWHLQQQVLRYGSGLHFGLTKQSEVDAQIRYGYLIPNPPA